MKKNAKLRRAQLDDFFKSLRAFNLSRPKRGWIKEVREALEMSMEDLAIRSNTIKQRIERIEKDEIAGKITLETIQKTADALECEFIYFLVPKTSLAQSIDAQAQKLAEEIAGKVDKTMSLEDQKTGSRAHKNIVQTIKSQILQQNSKTLWRK